MYKILFNWFIPDNGDYIILADELKVKDSFGEVVMLRKGRKITVNGYNQDINNDPFFNIKRK